MSIACPFHAYLRMVIILSKIYIDVCDNFKRFLILNKIKLKKNKFKKLVYLFIYKFLIKFSIIKKNKSKNVYIIYSTKYNKKIEKLLKTLEGKEVIISSKIAQKFKNEKYKYIKKYIEIYYKDLFKKNIIKIVKNIIDSEGELIEQTNIYVLTNSAKDSNILIDFAKMCKTLNIVTYNIRMFKRLEDELYNKFGISITISNNKRKSLAKAKYIINMQFSSDELKKYNINRNAIVFNLSEYKITDIGVYNGAILDYFKCNLK